MTRELPELTVERRKKISHRAGMRHRRNIRATQSLRNQMIRRLADLGLTVTEKNIIKLTRHQHPVKWSAYGIWNHTGMQHPIMSQLNMVTIARTPEPLKLKMYENGLIEICIHESGKP